MTNFNDFDNGFFSVNEPTDSTDVLGKFTNSYWLTLIFKKNLKKDNFHPEQSKSYITRVAVKYILHAQYHLIMGHWARDMVHPGNVCFCQTNRDRVLLCQTCFRPWGRTLASSVSRCGMCSVLILSSSSCTGRSFNLL